MHYWVTSRKTERVVPVLSLHPVLRAAGKKHFRGFLEDIKIVRC